MLGLLARAGHEIVPEEQADVVLVNTCSFIGDATSESVRTILELAGSGKKLVVTGCLAQRHPADLYESLPEVSAFLGTSDFDRIVEVVQRVEEGERFNAVTPLPLVGAAILNKDLPRLFTGLGPSAYLKIAEGCDHSCSFCIIPQMRGRYISRERPAILREARQLAAAGVKELVLIAEDTTRYGQKETGKFRLAALLHDLAEIDGIEWIRILYAYPNYMTQELLEAVRDVPKVVKYLDMPLQHTHPDVLRAMRRPRHEPPAELVARMRATVPGLVIRTTLIVGFPGETPEHVDHVLEFLSLERLDHVGAFAYSPEKGTPAADLKPTVAKRERNHRRRLVMEAQQEVSRALHEGLVGQTLDCLIEAIDVKTGAALGRTYRDAPEIDGTTYVTGDPAALPGDIVPIRITRTGPYDLYGEVARDEGSQARGPRSDSRRSRTGQER